MSVDTYFLQQPNGSFRRMDPPRTTTNIWVDIAHGKGVVIEERYYFTDLAQALAFYESGCKTRQFKGDDGQEIGLDHRCLYVLGHLTVG